MSKKETIQQPKISQKMVLRFAIGLLVIAALLFTWNYLSNYFLDVNPGHIPTSAGWISAVQETSTGAQAVIIKPDGSVLESPGYILGNQDKDLVWQPDGQRLFMSSNRGESGKSFNIFRWNPAANNVEQRSIGTRSHSMPTFPVDNLMGGDQTCLIISAGLVSEFDPKLKTTRQLLPFEGKTPTQAAGEEGGGSGSQFGQEYDKLGSSFRIASWCKGKKYIIAVMKKDDGETLVLQNLDPANSQQAAPQGIAAGSHIDFAVDPQTGNVIYAIQNFKFVDTDKIPPQFIKNGKVVPPFRHVIAIMDPSNPASESNGVIVASNDNRVCFGQPSVSPDGASIAFVAGPYDAAFTPKSLVVGENKIGGGTRATPLVPGTIFDPQWSPDSKVILYTQANGGKEDVMTIGKDASNPKNWTNGKGNFSDARLSPMQ